MKKDLQDIELTIKDFEDGCFAVSMVLNPAIKDNFVALSEHEIALKVIDEEKRIVVGYALIPDKRIYRCVEDKETKTFKEFNIFFTAQTIQLASEMYMKQLNLNNVTVEHEKKVEDVGIIESWITEDAKHDKINLYGIKPKVGGWAIMMKVNNDEEWAKVKLGEYRGFSIEGRFSGFENLMSKNNSMDIVEEIKAIINAELKSETVELGVIDDLKKQANQLTKLVSEASKWLREYEAKKNYLNLYLKKLSSERNTLNSNIDSLTKAANDLGIQVSSIDAYEIAKEASKEMGKIQIKIESALK